MYNYYKIIIQSYIIKIAKGPHLYEIGNKGGIILLAKYNQISKHVMYSIDEGETWNTYDLPLDINIQIENIRTDPYNSNLNFVIHGFNPINGTSTLLTIDFSKIYSQPSICILDNDYIQSPKRCFLGQTLIFLLKKDRKCYNSPNFSRKFIISGEFCSCTHNDYECNSGYHRDTPYSNCTSSSKIYGAAYKKI